MISMLMLIEFFRDKLSVVVDDGDYAKVNTGMTKLSLVVWPSLTLKKFWQTSCFWTIGEKTWKRAPKKQ